MKKRGKDGMAEWAALLQGKAPRAIVPKWWEQDKKLHEEFLAIIEGLHAYDRVSFMQGEELPGGIPAEEAEWRLRALHEHAHDILHDWHKRIAAHSKSFTKPRKASQERHARERPDKQKRDEQIKRYVLAELKKKKPYHVVRAAARKKFAYEYKDDPRRTDDPHLLSYSSVDKIISKARKESPHRG